LSFSKLDFSEVFVSKMSTTKTGKYLSEVVG